MTAVTEEGKHTKVAKQMYLFCLLESCGVLGPGHVGWLSERGHMPSWLLGWRLGTGSVRRKRRFPLLAWLTHTQQGRWWFQSVLRFLSPFLRPPPPAGPTAGRAHRGRGCSILWLLPSLLPWRTLYEHRQRYRAATPGGRIRATALATNGCPLL